MINNQKEKELKTLKQKLEEFGFNEGYIRNQIINAIKEWLQ